MNFIAHNATIFGMKMKKAVLILVSLLFVVVAGFSVFYFTRPKVAFFVGDIDSSYVKRLSHPDALTASYRSKIVYDPSDSYLKSADLIINHSVIGLDFDNQYNMEYDPVSLMEPYIFSLEQPVTLLYDEVDPHSAEVRDFLRGEISNLIEVPYNMEIETSEYGIYGNEVGSGTIITMDLADTIGFIRTLDNPEIAVSYLDAAALESDIGCIVFEPDWDSIIRNNL